MEKRKQLGLILVLVFIAVTGILFTADFAVSPEKKGGKSMPAGTDSVQEALPGQYSGNDDEDPDYAKESGESSQNESDPESFSDMPETSQSAQESLICVYVCGGVKHPGVYSLRAGARVYEALEMAGGAAEDARPQLMNLAETISDGERIYVPREGEEADPAAAVVNGGQTGAAASGSSAGAQGGAGGLIDLNKATAEQLMTLPGIGSSRAQDILAYRDANGPFGSSEDLMKVPGIKEGVYAKLKDRIVVK